MIAAAVHERLWMALPADTFASTPSTVVTAGAPTTWAASALYHQIGRADGDGWSANVAQDAPGFLSYGPYTTALPAGDQIATWNLMLDNVTADNATVVTLDAFDTTTGTVLASRVVTRQQFGMAYQYQGVSLPFTSQAGHTLEFRVFWHDTSYVKLQNVQVQSRANGVTEADQYDGDGNRVSRTRAGVTTTYGFGRWEQTGTTIRKYYPFGGDTIAVRDSVAGLSYLHSDHLGGASAVTTTSGTLSSWQRFDPWGQVRATSTGGVTQTTRNFTGQYLDATGLLYYNARYYDPSLGRFISADSIVPGNASGGMDGIALKPLTVSFSEPGFVSKLNQENQFGPWFTLSSQERQQLGSPMGPQNPQALNRYSYVLNNPLRFMDPSGHWTFSLSAGYQVFFASGFGGSVAFSFDGDGNLALSGGLNGGLSTGAAISTGPAVTVTDAPTVYDLEGDSTHIGVIGGEIVGASADISFGTDRKGDPVHGVTLSPAAVFAVSPPALPGVVYVTGEHDVIWGSTSVSDIRRKLGIP